MTAHALGMFQPCGDACCTGTPEPGCDCDLIEGGGGYSLVVRIAGLVEFSPARCGYCVAANTDYALSCMENTGSGYCFGSVEPGGVRCYPLVGLGLFVVAGHYILRGGLYVFYSGDPCRKSIVFELDLGADKPTLDDIIGAVLTFVRYDDNGGLCTRPEYCNASSATMTVVSAV